MKIQAIGHSGVVLTLTHKRFVFDDARVSREPFSTDLDTWFFVSHAHGDHFHKSIFDQEGPAVLYILSYDVPAPGDLLNAFRFGADQKGRVRDVQVQTLRSTDEGVAFLLETEDLTIYHAGDLNWWHWAGETPAYNAAMERDFKAATEALCGKSIDIAFLPLDPRLEDSAFWGFDYVMRQADVKKAIPIHMWGRTDIFDRFVQSSASAPYRDRLMLL